MKTEIVFVVFLFVFFFVCLLWGEKEVRMKETFKHTTVADSSGLFNVYLLLGMMILESRSVPWLTAACSWCWVVISLAQSK